LDPPPLNLTQVRLIPPPHDPYFGNRFEWVMGGGCGSYFGGLKEIGVVVGLEKVVVEGPDFGPPKTLGGRNGWKGRVHSQPFTDTEWLQRVC